MLHVSDRTGPSSGNTFIKQLLNNILICCMCGRNGGILLCTLIMWWTEL